MDAATVTAVLLAFTAGLLLGRRWGRMGARSLAPVLVACLIGGPVFAAPPEAIAAALADAKGLPPDTAAYTYYFDQTHWPPDVQQAAAKVMSYHVNSLSQKKGVRIPRMIANGAMLAIDLRQYGISKATMEKLADVEAKEPYFHVVVEEVQTYTPQYQAPTYQPGYVAPAGYGAPYPSQQPTAYSQPVTKRTIRKTVPAPWLPKTQVDELYRLTKSAIPVMRSDWFFFQTAVSKNRHVGYYDFLGLGKKEADFLELVGADPKLARRKKLEGAATVARSGVAINNRGITRFQAITGGYWATQDYKTSTDKQNTARLLKGDTDPIQGDASEVYGVLPNRLFAYWLQDKDGNRQDFVPQDIALDKHAGAGNDRNIYAGTMSCTRCHVEGLRPINNFARELFSGGINLKSVSFEKLEELQDLYLGSLPADQKEDNSRFAAAVKACNGLEVADNARMVGQFWESYFDADVTPGTLAAELGCTEQLLIAKAKASVAANGITDPVIAAYAKDPPIPMRREHVEEAYPFFQKLIGGTVP